MAKKLYQSENKKQFTCNDVVHACQYHLFSNVNQLSSMVIKKSANSGLLIDQAV